MAIHDLLWACPICGAVDALARTSRGERCTACGAVFRRRQRSLIEVTRPDGRVETRPAGEWAALLPAEPPGPAVGEGGAGESGEGGAGRPGRPGRATRVLARFALGDEAIRRAGVFLGTMERLGPERPGRLRLTDAAVELSLDGGEQHRWPLDDIAALQASSSTIQLRPRGQAIVSFRFPQASVRLWEEWLATALRTRWRARGRGEIVEFQPRIVVAPASPASPR